MDSECGRPLRLPWENRLMLCSKSSSLCKCPLQSDNSGLLEVIKMLMYHVGERRDIHCACIQQRAAKAPSADDAGIKT